MSVPTKVVCKAEWDAACTALLVKEKQPTRARDALAAERRRLPTVRVQKEYRFEGPDGNSGLLDLFEGRHQLIVYRFFLDPGMQIAAYPEDAALAARCSQTTRPNSSTSTHATRRSRSCRPAPKKRSATTGGG